MSAKKIIKDMMTGPDDQTFEIAHVIWFFGAMAVIAIAAYAAYKTGVYPSGFGTDFGAVSAGGAAGAYGRAKADQTKDGDVDNTVDK